MTLHSLTTDQIARLAYYDRTGRHLPQYSRGAHGLLTGSGSNVRRYSCPCCGEVITTDCARYRETQRAARSVAAHVSECVAAYVAHHDAIQIRHAGEVSALAA